MSKQMTEDLARLTAEVDQAIKAQHDGNDPTRDLAKLNKELRTLHEYAQKTRKPLKLREQIDKQRQRVRKALGFT